VTAGILSARHREINNSLDEYLQIDAPINKGNSGGPTFDTEGNVIGVNTAIYSPSGGSVGIAFAIPADTVRAVISQLKAHGSVTRGWLGVQIQPVTKDLADSLGLKKAEGALVGETIPNSPAAKAGIKASDVVTAVNGKPIKDAHDLANTIGGLAPKTEVKLSIVHNGTEKTVSLALGKMPSQVEANASPKGNNGNGNANLAKLGLTLAPAARVAGAGKKGVVVTDVDSSGVAADRGISTGDIILEVAGKPVATPGEVRKEINQARLNGKRNVLIRLKSGDTTHFVALPVGHG
jgi:serine protease Do